MAFLFLNSDWIPAEHYTGKDHSKGIVGLPLKEHPRLENFRMVFMFSRSNHLAIMTDVFQDYSLLCL